MTQIFYNKNVTVCVTSCVLLFHVLKLAEVFSKDGMSFLASCQNLVPRPWVIDDLDAFKAKWGKKTWKKASLVKLFMLQDTVSSVKVSSLKVFH